MLGNASLTGYLYAHAIEILEIDQLIIKGSLQKLNVQLYLYPLAL